MKCSLVHDVTLEAGDIICTQEMSAAVSFGQGVVKSLRRIGRGGSSASSKWNHAAIVVDPQRIAHAVMPHVMTERLNQCDWARERGEHRVYRFNDGSKAKEAAKTAEFWCGWCPNNVAQSQNHEDSGFSKGKALGSAFATKRFGTGATRRAQLFHDNRFAGLGTSTAAWERIGGETFYCAMFVVACYQSVDGPPACANYMGIDALGATPMALVGYLKDHPGHWQQIA